MKLKYSISQDFDIPLAELADLEVIAYNTLYEDYVTYGYVLFQWAGQLYEVHGVDEDCAGVFENQWLPVPISREFLIHQLHDSRDLPSHHNYFKGSHTYIRNFITLH